MSVNNLFKTLLEDNKDSISSDDEFPEEIGKFIGGAFRHILKEASKANKVQKEKETLESVKKQNAELIVENKQLKQRIIDLEKDKYEKIFLDLD
jgi:hypothetical protein